jgi:putative ATP-dependent endonuclease of OLD family
VLAIEEPEAHLHPNAQKKLFRQMDAIVGQKVISTHSPYISATADIKQLRNFYKDKTVTCGRLLEDGLDHEDVRKIKRQVIHTRGEIFFSKLIIFFEGETEEQALPILAEKYFGMTPVELAVDFVGVGGCNSYLPFVRFAEAFNIPWLIFSDAENTPEKQIKASVKDQFSKCGSKKSEAECIIFLDDGNCLEQQFLDDGYSDEIKNAIISVTKYENEKHKSAKVKEIYNYGNEELYKVITGNKTKYGPAIAEQILNSTKSLPPKIIDLFDRVSEILQLNKV